MNSKLDPRLKAIDVLRKSSPTLHLIGHQSYTPCELTDRYNFGHVATAVVALRGERIPRDELDLLRDHFHTHCRTGKLNLPALNAMVGALKYRFWGKR